MTMVELLQRIVIVTRGPDPWVHLIRKMDCRIKSGNDRVGAH